MPDLVYQMVCVLGELPMYHELMTAEPLTHHRAAQLMAWTWEGGRRYGVQQAMAVCESSTEAFKSVTDAMLTDVLDSSLELPPPAAEESVHKPLDMGTDPPNPNINDDSRTKDEGSDQD